MKKYIRTDSLHRQTRRINVRNKNRNSQRRQTAKRMKGQTRNERKKISTANKNLSKICHQKFLVDIIKHYQIKNKNDNKSTI